MASKQNHLIARLLNGTEKSDSILIVGSLQCPPKHIFYAFIQQFIHQNHHFIHLTTGSTIFHTKQCSSISLLDLVNEHPQNPDLLDALVSMTTSSTSSKPNLAIDSLSPLFMLNDTNVVLNTLARLSSQCRMLYTFCKDVQSEQTLSALKMIATTHINIEFNKQARCYVADIVHKKSHPRLQFTVLNVQESFILSDNGSISYVGIKEHIDETIKNITNSSFNLPFNLNLKDDEKEAKEELILPYLKYTVYINYYIFSEEK